jgi:hypothetical protein
LARRYGGTADLRKRGSPDLVAAAARPAGLPPEGGATWPSPRSRTAAPPTPALVLAVAPVSVTHPRSMSSRFLHESGPSPGAWRAGGAPLMIVKKVLTPYGRLVAAKLLATLCRVWPIEARPDGTGDAPVGSKSTDDV